MRRLVIPLAVIPILLGGVAGFAQSNPSAEQIIDALKPTGSSINGSTRGIRLATPGDQGTAPAAAPSTPGGQAARPASPGAQMAATRPTGGSSATSGRSINLTVDFATGSAQLTPQAMAALDELGRALSNSELSAYRFRIEGHTDTVGTADYNRTLSEQRAQAVVTYLTTRFQVAPSRLQAVGVGEQGLLVPTPPQTAEPRNRRVQIINLDA